MRIKIDQITESGLDLVLSQPADHFPVLTQMAEQGQAGFALPVTVEVRLWRIGQLVKADAAAHTSVTLTCSRCLAEFTQPVAARFSLTFAPRPAGETASAAKDAGADADLFHHDGKEVDLTEGVQEQIVLALPMQPLCDPACKGLCPGCGVDLNTQACTCPPSASAGPFAALKNIGLKKTK